MRYPALAAINGKIFVHEVIALDNSLGINFDKDNKFISFQTLFEFNKSFGINDGYNWYAGLGPQFNYFNKGGYIQNDGTMLDKKLLINTDAVFGVEFTSSSSRLNAAAEAGPSITVSPITKVGFFVNVALRYVVSKPKKSFKG